MFDIFDVLDGKVDLRKEGTEKPKRTRRKKVEETVAEPQESQPEPLNNNATEQVDAENVDSQETNELDDELEEDNSKGYVEDIPLTFLENPITNRVIVGRKRSVFNKYGEESALFLGRVNESGYEQKDIYFDSLDPQVIFVCGSRGSGKCLVGETEIVTSEGKLLRIEDLKESCEVLAMDDRFKLSKTVKESFYKRSVNKILEITLNSGKKIKLTHEHPLFTIHGWKPASELKVGQRIATPRVIPFFGKGRTKDHNVKLLAYFIAEGHLGNDFALFSNMDEEIVSDFSDAVNEFDPTLRIEEHSKSGCYRVAQMIKAVDIKDIKRNNKGMFVKGSKIHTQKSSLIKYFIDLGLYNKLSKEKFVPQFVFGLNKQSLNLFLNRLFSCDGSIYYTSCWEMSYSSSSEKLIRQVQHLLLRFGVYSKLRVKKIRYCNKYVTSYELVIDGEFVEKYIDNIGFYGKKAEIAKLAKKSLSKRKYNPNLDTIPKEIFDLFKVNNWAELGRKLGYSCPKSIISSKEYNISRRKLERMAKALNNKFLLNLARSDIYWDSIVAVKEIKKKTTVYDISVPKYHNFVANDIIVHNSYVLGVLAEELAMKNQNVGMVVIDPVGVFWSMKHPNRDDREVKLLAEYGLDPKGLDNLFVFIPEGAKSKTPKETYDSTFTIMPSLLTAEDWTITFGLERFSPTGLLLEKVLKKVEEGYRTTDGLIFKGKGKNYDINDLIYCLETSEDLTSKERGFKRDSLRALISRFEAAKSWGIFSKTGTPLIEVVVPGQLTVIDVSFLDENVSALLVGILARRILAARKISTRKQAATKMGSEEESTNLEYDIPPTWLFIDEAHTLIPGGGIVTPASKALIEYVKQGRQPGCSLVFATQQPSAIDTRVLSQVGTLISYKLVFDDDIKAVFKRMPTQVPSSFKKPGFLKKLEIGVPLIADRVETTSRAFVAKVRPRMSQHEGRETQTAEVKHKMTQSEVLDNMVFIAKNKLGIYDDLDRQGMETLLKILNMKYKTNIDFEEFSNSLISSGVKLENDKYSVEKEDDSPSKYQERIVYKTIVPEYDESNIEGIAKRVLGWQEIAVRSIYRPIFKVNYKVYNDDGSFVADICYIDPVKSEFLQFVDKHFLYSQGFNELRLFDADDINILMKLPNKKGFDVDWLKTTTGFGEVKLKRVMDRFVQVGLARKEKRGIKNVYFLLKEIELPKKPLLKVLSSFGKLPLQDVEVQQDQILEPRISMESLRNTLGTLWGNIKIDDIETLLREEIMVTNLDTKESVMFETFTGKKVE